MSVIDDNAMTNLKSIGGDKLLTRIIDLYLERTPQQLSDLLEAVDSEDYEILERVSHSMKSSAGNVGATKVYELAASVEQAAEKRQLEDPAAAIGELKMHAEQAMKELEDLRPATA